MLNKVTVFSPTPAVPPLVFDLKDIPETALFEMHNIDGLEAVKATITTSQFASGDGEGFGGSSIGKRNLVFTIGLNPDWNEFTMTALRRKLDAYFMPQMNVTIFFEGDEQAPVVISGYVESNEPNIFTKDPEHQVSIICPEPDFVAVDPIVFTTSANNDLPDVIDYNGTIETGYNLEVSYVDGVGVGRLFVKQGNPVVTIFEVGSEVNEVWTFIMSSVKRKKFAQSVNLTDESIVNALGGITDTSIWPKLYPGNNNFKVDTDEADNNLLVKLTYYARYGSL